MRFQEEQSARVPEEFFENGIAAIAVGVTRVGEARQLA